MTVSSAPNQDPDAIATLIDNEIAKLADMMYQCLSRALVDDDLADKLRCPPQAVGDALDDLGKLSRGISPNYHDDWVALFYLTWYQPRQVNLVASICQTLAKERGSTFLSNLRVVDVGCGALATLIGIAATCARLRIDTQIVIHGIDPCRQMTCMGKNLVHRMSSLPLGHVTEKRPAVEIERFSSILSKSSICIYASLEDYIDYITSPRRNKIDSGCRLWLAAIHAFYDSNMEDMISNNLKDLRAEADLDIFTGMNEDLVKNIAGSPQTDRIGRIDPFFDGPSKKVWNWRKKISRMFDRCRDDEENKYFLYLMKKVLWTEENKLPYVQISDQKYEMKSKSTEARR